MARRGEGLRLRITRIKGVTKGRSSKILRKPWRFQCPPLDQFQRDYGHNFTRENNYLGREYVIRSGRKLRSIPLRTLVVEYGNYVVERRWDIDDMVDDLIVLSEEGYPFRLLATHQYGTGKDAAEYDGPVVLESVSVTEQAGEQDARYLDLQFTEYDDPEVRRRKHGKDRGGGKDFPFTITLRKDGSFTESSKDFKLKAEVLTFGKIAREAYGKASLAPYLMQSQKPPVKDWGPSTPIIKHPRFKNGGKIRVPAPVLLGENPSNVRSQDV
jgi:hypothetical protein